MLTVSPQWHDASRAQFRYQAYLYASLEVVPPGLREGAVITSDDTNSYASVDTIMDTETLQPTKYVTLEPNRWRLDGQYKLLTSDDVLRDWWSEHPVASTTPVLHFEFNDPYTIPGIYFLWDYENDTYPTKIRVIGYNATNEQVYDILLEGINSKEGFFDSLAMDDVKYVDIEILDWVAVGWRARVLEITFGLIFKFDSVNNGRIMSATQVSKADPLNSKLPTHTMKITLRNYDKYFDATLQSSLSKYIAQQQVLRTQWAFATSNAVVEFAPKQVFLLETFKVPADSKEVVFELTNRLELLDSDFYLGTYTGSARTLTALVDYILTNSNILKEFDGQIPWVIPESFNSITTTAPIPSGATNALLQLIALAGCTWLRTRSMDGFIEFYESQAESSPECAITPDQELGDPEITIHDRLRSISIGVYSYIPKSTADKVGSGDYTIAGTQAVLVKYKVDYATNVSATVTGTGATLVSAKYYASYAQLTISAPTSGAAVSVTLTGNEVEETVAYLETYRDATIADGRDVTIENPLVTSYAHAQQVSDYVRSYYLRRNEYKLSYTGYPQVEAGDKIDLSTIYGSDVVEVKNNTIEFNGGWTGTMEVV